jgi:hypothetical protein
MKNLTLDRHCIRLEVKGDVCERMRKSKHVLGAFMNPERTMTYVLLPLPSVKSDGDLFIKTAEEKLNIKSVSFEIMPSGTKLIFCPPSNSSN